MEPTSQKSPESAAPKVEKEWSQSGWKHPYVLYLGGTALLFAFLLLMGYLAIENEWIPKR